jgi:hypothetical protein
VRPAPQRSPRRWPVPSLSVLDFFVHRGSRAFIDCSLGCASESGTGRRSHVGRLALGPWQSVGLNWPRSPRMHRSQALCGAFTMRRRAVRRPETGRFLSGGTLASSSSLYVTGARGGTPGPGCQLLPRARTGSSRARYGAVPRTDDQPLSEDRNGPAGRVLTTAHAAGEPLRPATRRGMNTAVSADPLADRTARCRPGL